MTTIETFIKDKRVAKNQKVLIFNSSSDIFEKVYIERLKIATETIVAINPCIFITFFLGISITLYNLFVKSKMKGDDYCALRF